MPAASLKAMAKKSGVSLKRAEHLWSKAKKLATKQGRFKKDGKEEYYKYVMGIVKRMLSYGKRAATASDGELEVAGLGIIVADLETLKHMEAPVKFVHESGSTITLASDGTITLHATGEVKTYLKKPVAEKATVESAAIKRGVEAATATKKVMEVAASVRARSFVDRFAKRLTKVEAADEEGDESKKWEGIALAILKALEGGAMSAAALAEAVSRSQSDVDATLTEMESQGGVKKDGENWSLA